MKIYTKTGDKGETSLFGGKRVSKANLRIDTYGTIDELNAHIGLVRDVLKSKREKNVLSTVQNKLFVIGSILASDPTKPISKMIPKFEKESIELLEKEIDFLNETLDPLQYFILPGGHENNSFCHIARCVCRRAERITVALSEIEKVDGLLIKYLNRLSDYLFVLSRKMAKDLKIKEIKWNP